MPDHKGEKRRELGEDGGGEAKGKSKACRHTFRDDQADKDLGNTPDDLSELVGDSVTSVLDYVL